MDPVSSQVIVSAPREDVFAFLNDLANRASFADHFMGDMRLTRPRSSGTGAAARFHLALPRASTWAETMIVESDAPRRIAEEGRMARAGRSRMWTVWELTAEGGGATRVDLTSATVPSTRVDAFKERFGARRWYRAQIDSTLRRLRRVFEEERERPLARVSVAGYEALKAPRFGS